MNKMKLKYLVRSVSTSNAVIKNQASEIYLDGYYPAYSASGQDVWLPKYDYDANAIIISAVGARCGKTFLAKGKFGLCANTHILFVNEKIANINFLNYILDNEQWWIKGGTAQPFVKVEQSLNQKIYYPPIDEQERIAEFLDKKCEMIDKRLENLEAKIQSLKEYKKALISECVTKGLNNGILEFRDSGIPWIGRIPKHWAASKIKYCFDFSSGLNITKADLIENGIPVISYGQIHSKDNSFTYIKDDLLRFVSNDYLNNKKSLVNRGDFIFADTSEDLDGAGNFIFIDRNSRLFAGYHTIVLKNKIEFSLAKFLSYLFQADIWRSQIRLSVSGVKVFSITKKILSNCEILVPPLDEQERIAEFLDSKCASIDKLKENYQSQIATLKEYKKSLIYECVSGKKEI